MRAMRIEMKTTFASLLALGVCVWVAEARADGDEISADNSVEMTALQSLNGGDLTLIGMHAHSEQTGTVEGNDIYNEGGSITTGAAINNINNSHGIVMQAANSGINSLIQQTTTINILLGPQN
jgi:hypothetical protein